MSELNLEYAALLMIDVQREYFAERSPLRIPDGPLVLGKLRTLVEACRETDLLPDRARPPRGGAGRARVRARTARSSRRCPRSRRAASSRRSSSTRPARSRRPSSAPCSRSSTCDCLVIAGFMTHMCCDTTARQAAERGLDVVFLTDGTATRDLAFEDRVVSHRDVQAATLAAQADGFSTLADVAAVRTWLHGLRRARPRGGARTPPGPSRRRGGGSAPARSA